MDDLVVDDELSATIIDDKSSDAAPTIVKGTGNLGVETTLVNDRQALLDITRLSHADNSTTLLHIKDSVLLEDRSEHALNDDRWLWVADKRRLLVQLSRKEIDTEVSVLTGLTRLRDSDDLARSTLENHEVTDSDEVAWNGDSVTWNTTPWLDISH